jgi:8-oxo-dGTP diphosphatase
MSPETRNKHGLTETEFLRQYDAGKYPRPSVTVDILLFTVGRTETGEPQKELQVLLIQRGDHPDLGKWALPGGFVEMGESLEAAALRELYEETHVIDVYLEQLYTWGDPKRDPRTRVIGCSYMALVKRDALLVEAGDDAAEARWFNLQSEVVAAERSETSAGSIFQETTLLRLTSQDLTLTTQLKTIQTVTGNIFREERAIAAADGIAFDHAKIIHYGLERLRNKLEYTDIAFGLMPEYFTLAELQKVYEAILGKGLSKAGFQRKVAHMMVEREAHTRDVARSPAKLYRFNPEWRTIRNERWGDR